jgi:hypothetical protein
MQMYVFYRRSFDLSISLGLPLDWQFPTKKSFHGRWNRWNNWLVPAKFRLLRGTEKIIFYSYFGCFLKLIFSAYCHTIPFRASELTLPWTSECPRNEQFLPRDNRNRSEFILQNFLNDIPLPTLVATSIQAYSSPCIARQITDFYRS